MSLPVKRRGMLNPKRHTAKAGHNKAPRRRDRLSDVKFTVIPSLFVRCHHSNATPNVITSVRKAEPSPSGAAAPPFHVLPVLWLWPNSSSARADWLSSHYPSSDPSAIPSDETCLALSQIGKIWADTEPMTPLLPRYISATSRASPSPQTASQHSMTFKSCAPNQRICTWGRLYICLWCETW